MIKVFTGDEGTVIILDCGADVSSATVRKIKVRKPSGVQIEWAAQAEGTNAIKYVVQAGDVVLPGSWWVQAYIEMPGWKGRGEWSELLVEK